MRQQNNLSVAHISGVYGQDEFKQQDLAVTALLRHEVPVNRRRKYIAEVCGNGRATHQPVYLFFCIRHSLGGIAVDETSDHAAIIVAFQCLKERLGASAR